MDGIQPPEPRKPLRVCELFAGVGGFHLGLDRAGMRVVWANQWEPGTRAQQHDTAAQEVKETKLLSFMFYIPSRGFTAIKHLLFTGQCRQISSGARGARGSTRGSSLPKTCGFVECEAAAV